jgi:hypothetical protein
MQGIKCGAMTWTKLPAKPGKRPQTTQSDALKCLELIEDFMYWYFDSFLIPLLKVRSAFCLMFSFTIFPDNILLYGIRYISKQSSFLSPRRLEAPMSAPPRPTMLNYLSEVTQG